MQLCDHVLLSTTVHFKDAFYIEANAKHKSVDIALELIALGNLSKSSFILQFEMLSHSNCNFMPTSHVFFVFFLSSFL